MNSQELRALQEAYMEVYQEQELDEAEGSYGATPKAYSAASKTKMTAKRKPFLKAMKSRTNPANRTSPYDSPRKGLTADDRERARAGSAHGVGTRQDHDYPSQGPGGVTKSAKKLRKQKAMGEFGEGVDLFDCILEHLVAEGYADTNKAALAIMANMSEEWKQSIVEEVLDEAEGSYGQTPTARKAYGDLANKRRATPASGFAKRGEKTTKVKSAEKHFNRTGNPDAGNRGKKSTKPSFNSGARKGMTQSDRDHARGEAEYGHTGYDPDFDGGPSAPGGKPKGKKAERQKKTGVSAD